MMLQSRNWLVAVIAASCGDSASAVLPTVIFSNIQSSPTSNIPGLPGHKFYNGTSIQSGRPFNPPFGSPNGQRWILKARIWDAPPRTDSVVLAGGGIDGTTAAVIVRTDTPAFFDGNVFYNLIAPEVGINDDGELAFASQAGWQIVARWSPESGFVLMAREGVQAPGQPPGVGYGSGAGDVHILDDGRVAFGSGGLTGSGGNAVFINSAIDNGVVLFQDGVTIPENQSGVPAAPLWFPYSFRIDATGQHYIYDARLTNGHDVVIVNNGVVADRDMPLPGGYPGFFDDGDDAGARVSPYNGHYAFRSPADFVIDSGDVVVVDDRVVAVEGEPIVPGHSDVFDNGGETPFFLNIVNSHGDYLVGGVARQNQFFSYAVLIFNGTTMIPLYGQQVDLNGDGLPNDNMAVGPIFDSGYLTDDGRLFFTCDLRQGGQKVGEAFLWTRMPRAPDTNCDGRIDFFDIDPFLLALFDEAGYAAAWPECWRITADVNRDGGVDFFDIDPFISCLFASCP